jgi:hypothetical protein
MIRQNKSIPEKCAMEILEMLFFSFYTYVFIFGNCELILSCLNG